MKLIRNALASPKTDGATLNFFFEQGRSQYKIRAKAMQSIVTTIRNIHLNTKQNFEDKDETDHFEDNDESAALLVNALLEETWTAENISNFTIQTKD